MSVKDEIKKFKESLDKDLHPRKRLEKLRKKFPKEFLVPDNEK